MQGQVYLTLVLFPAEKKKLPLYGRDMDVIDVVKFVVKHGSNVHQLIM